MPMTAMTTGLPRPFWTCLLVIALPGTVFTTVAPDIEVISAWPSANLYFEESLTLTCHGGGDPAPTYTWTRDSGSLPARAVVDGGAGTLTLADATDADGGVYTCTADNGVGTSATLNITVVGCPDVSTCPDSNANCASWAAGGQCESNPGYMLSACRLSCGVCFPNLGAHCTTTRRGRSWDTWECYDVTSVPDAIRTELNLDTFYQKYLHAYGIPVLGSSILPDAALRRACYDVLFMLADRKDIRDSYYDYYGRAGIMAETEVTLDIPEHSGLDPDFNTRARGLGATVSKPVSTGAEENVLCYNTDPYKVEDIFIHEFAHGVDILGARKAVSDFITRLQAAYDSALANGLWANTYADDTRDEYWAEGVQSYFNVNHESDPPDGIHNHVNTRVELQAYDPDLYAMVEEIYPCGNFPVKRCERDYASYTLKIDCFSENYQRLTVVGTAVWGETSTSTAASQGTTPMVSQTPAASTAATPTASMAAQSTGSTPTVSVPQSSSAATPTVTSRATTKTPEQSTGTTSTVGQTPSVSTPTVLTSRATTRTASTAPQSTGKTSTVGQMPSVSTSTVGQTPTLSTPTVGQTPTVSTPTVGQTPTVNTPTLGQTPTVSTPTVGQTPTVSTPTVGQTPTVSTPTLGQTPTVSTPTLGQTPTVSTPTVGQTPTVSTPTVGQTPTVSTPTLGQTPTVSTPTLGQTPTSSTPTLGQTPTVSTLTVGQTPTVNSPTLGQTPAVSTSTLGQTLTASTPMVLTSRATTRKASTATQSTGTGVTGTTSVTGRSTAGAMSSTQSPSTAASSTTTGAVTPSMAAAPTTTTTAPITTTAVPSTTTRAVTPSMTTTTNPTGSPGTGTVRTTPTLVTRLVTTVNATESLPKPPGTDIVTIVAGVLGGVACVLVIAGAIGAVVKCMAAKTAVVAVKPA
ncbi:uncharacterized protein [Branchiostoma lanceolatum]|uniref:uncharacterized protein isoform X2 n=1 Tax=Branchiostoma lanceolatum TaxID=7740 RepID=UPI003454A758